MKVVIIAGGQGTRIASIASDIPKAMIPVAGKPVLEYEVEMAKRYGFTDFIFIIGHLGEQIKSYFGDGNSRGVRIDYYEETFPLGTAGALAYLTEKLNEDFFVFYGDTVMDIDMLSMLRFHQAKRADATLLLHPNDHPYDSDIVDLDPLTRRVKHIYHKPHPVGFVSHNMVNAAVFIFSPRVLQHIEKGVKTHIEKHVLARSLDAGLNLYGYVSAEYVKDMGTPDRYMAVEQDVKSGTVAARNRQNKRPAVFLDRDGVINEEVDLLCHHEQVRLIEGAAEAVRLINQSGCIAVVVTNQPVIARNLCDFDELDLIHQTLETQLGKAGAYLNAIYFCPHHPDAGYPEERKEYKIVCNCRKPAPGMLLRAADDWNIDLAQSYMIGDSARDVEAGERAGVKQSIKIPTNTPNALLNAVKTILL